MHVGRSSKRYSANCQTLKVATRICWACISWKFVAEMTPLESAARTGANAPFVLTAASDQIERCSGWMFVAVVIWRLCGRAKKEKSISVWTTPGCMAIERRGDGVYGMSTHDRVTARWWCWQQDRYLATTATAAAAAAERQTPQSAVM